MDATAASHPTFIFLQRTGILPQDLLRSANLPLEALTIGYGLLCSLSSPFFLILLQGLGTCSCLLSSEVRPAQS